MISKFIRFSVIAIILQLPGKPVLSQPDYFKGYHVEHFTDENGLPQNSIGDLLFDDKGFLWLASQVGLVRFDGNSFVLYAPEGKPAMGSNFLSLGRGDSGIYCQTLDRHLYSYTSGSRSSLEPLNAPDLKTPFLLNRRRIFDFGPFLNPSSPADAGERRLIFNDLFEHYRNFFPVDASHTYLLYGDSLCYYSASDPPRGGRLVKLAPAADHSLSYLVINGNLYELENGSVLAIYRDGKRIGGVSPISGDLEKDTRGHPPGQDTFHLFTGDVNHLLVNRKLYRISPDAAGGLHGDLLLDIGFAANIAAVECNPKLGILLIATQTEGFYLLRKSEFETPGFSTPLKEQLSRYLFGPMALRAGKDILTDRLVFNSSGKFNLLDPGLPLWQKCLYIDHAGKVWTSINKLPRMLNAEMKPEKVYPILDAPVAGYAEDEPNDIYCLTDNSLWRLNGDSFQMLFSDEGIRFEGPAECIGLVAPHLFWIGGNHGLIEYDTRENKTRIIAALREAHVRCIHACRDGSVLLGTYGQGYYYYHKGRFFHMPLDKNGFLVTAHCFLEDGKGAVWIPCNKGLFKIPKADMDSWCDSTGGSLYYYYYGKQDGLKTNEFNGGVNASGLITPDGFVALLSMKGIVCFHTDSLRSEFPAGPIGITHIEIDGIAHPKTDSIELAPNYNSLFVQISCPYLGNRNNLYLEYYVKGLVDEWKEVPRDGNIDLSRFGPGNYTLLVRKVNGFGKNNFSYREWKITVIPHFYQTGWFFMLSALVLFLLMFFLVQARLKLKQKQKEIRVKADTLKDTVVALEDTVEKLQGSQKALLQNSKMKEKLISLVIHDLRSPIRFLSMLAADLNDRLAGFSPDELKERTYGIKKGANELYTFSEDFLLWVTAQRNNFSVSERLFAVKPLLQEIFEFFRDQVQQKGNTLCIQAADELKMYSDPHILITIIRNLVDNANKYTDQGKITIRAYEEGDQLFISVADTGKGMNRQQIDAFLQNQNLDDIRSGSQLGHKFIFDLTKRIGGIVSLDSKEKEGTTVVLRFNKV